MPDVSRASVGTAKDYQNRIKRAELDEKKVRKRRAAFIKRRDEAIVAVFAETKAPPWVIAGWTGTPEADVIRVLFREGCITTTAPGLY